MILVSSGSYLCPVHWSQVLCSEWRCSWSSANRQYSIYIWVNNNFIAYQGATYIRELMLNSNLMRNHSPIYDLYFSVQIILNFNGSWQWCYHALCTISKWFDNCNGCKGWMKFHEIWTWDLQNDALYGNSLRVSIEKHVITGTIHISLKTCPNYKSKPVTTNRQWINNQTGIICIVGYLCLFWVHC